MIRTRRLVPDVYTRQSRDFQFIGRLYEMVLNSVKTNADMIWALPNSEDADNEFLELLSTTLGFRSKHNYSVDQLKSLCSCFSEVIRNKGSVKAIEMACNAVVGAEGITEPISIDYSENESGIVLYISQELTDLNLLRDLMDYILPAGLSYNIVKTLRASGSSTSQTSLSHYVKRSNGNFDEESKRWTGFADSTISRIGDEFTESYLSGPELLNTPSTMENAAVVDAYYDED